MKLTKFFIGACAGALLLSGCMTDELIKQRTSDERITLIENRSFNLGLLSTKTLVNDDGLLTVDANVLLSRTGSFRWFFTGDPVVTIWYHFDWIDAQGNIYPPVQREMSALPGNIISFHGVAPEEKYIKYRLTIFLKKPEKDDEAAKKSGTAGKKHAEPAKAKPAAKPQPPKDVKPNNAGKPAGKTRLCETEVKKAPPKAAAPETGAKKAPAKAAQPQKLTEPFD